MLNLQDYISHDGKIRRFKVNDLLFAEYKCIVEDSKLGVWWHNNFFSFVISGEMIWKTPLKEYAVKPGEFFFVKKGAFVAGAHHVLEYCDLLIFVPDEFIKNVIEKYKLKIPVHESSANQSDIVFKLHTDDVLNSYFHSLLTLFHQTTPPSDTLLKIKFEELIVSLSTSQTNSPLKEYFKQLCFRTKISIQEIMEANFYHDLSLEEFARLCSRSLSSFKREFKNIYHVAPGKWLLEKRLEHSRFLMETTDNNIDEVFFDCGFKNSSHFIRAFKNKFGITPGKFRSKGKLQSTYS